MNGQRPNPFHVLGLSTDATDAEVVQRGQDIQFTATDDEAQLARWAVQELNTHPRTRARHELLEVPGADYRDADWERFARRHRALPVDPNVLAAGGPALRAADFDPLAILGLVIDDLLTPPIVDLGPAIEGAPEPPRFGPPPMEVRDVIFG